jgi:carbamoyl-phosphate synthase large subunit
MKSTGEVMGIGSNFAEAFAKAMRGSGAEIPTPGTAFLSVREADKEGIVEIARQLHAQGFSLVATGGTGKVIRDADIECLHINKVKEGRPHIVDMIKNDEIALIVNTTEGRSAIADSYTIRREALMHAVCYTTTLSGARATCQAMAHREIKQVYCIQTLHQAVEQ